MNNQRAISYYPLSIITITLYNIHYSIRLYTVLTPWTLNPIIYDQTTLKVGLCFAASSLTTNKTLINIKIVDFFSEEML